MTSRWFYRLINSISDTPINESAADFRLVSRRVVEVFQGQIRERNQFLRGLFGWVGFPSLAVRFKVAARPAGRTKYSVRRMVRFGVDGVVSFSKTPLQAAVYFGFAFGALGFLYAFVTLVQFLAYRSFPSGWTTIIILISIFSGTQLVFLGILGEYIGAIFDEVKARPHYVVEERVNFPPRPGAARLSASATAGRGGHRPQPRAAPAQEQLVGLDDAGVSDSSSLRVAASAKPRSASMARSVSWVPASP